MDGILQTGQRIGLRWLTGIFVGVLASSFFLFLGIPLAALLISEAPDAVWTVLQESETLQAIQISIVTTCVSTFLAVLCGLPVAYVLARVHFRGRGVLETLVTLPTVLPPVVAGLSLLLAFGGFGLIGCYFNGFGIIILFSF